MTQAGIILGTAAYMSPGAGARQAAWTSAADIWAFGVVLYEMLTGANSFDGETVTDVIAAILQRAGLDALPAATPASVRRLLRRCLEKDPRRRLHDIADARLEIEDAIAAPATAVPAPSGRMRRRLAAAIVVIAFASAALGWYLKPSGRSPRPARAHRRVSSSRRPSRCRRPRACSSFRATAGASRTPRDRRADSDCSSARSISSRARRFRKPKAS